MRRFTSVVSVATVVVAGLFSGRTALTLSEGFVPTGDLQSGPRTGSPALRLADGRAFIVAGYGTVDGFYAPNAEVYDASSGTWSIAGTMSTGRSLATANLLHDGRVLVAGGNYYAPAFATTEIWDPATGAFTPGASMSIPRRGHIGVTLADGRVLVAGGAPYTDTPIPVATAEIYDPSTNTWTPTGSLLSRREIPEAVLLADGRVLVTGGSEGAATNYSPTNVCQVFDPALGIFALAAPMAVPRSGHKMARLSDGRVLVVGGISDSASTRVHSAEIYDPAANSWSSAGTTTCGGGSPTLTLLADGRALAAGGQGQSSAPCALADIFDPGTGTFSPLPPMQNVRLDHSATLLPDGRVVIAGGYNNFATFPLWNSSSELFIPVPANRAPVANAGPDQVLECTGPTGAAVTLDGSGSTDADGDVLAYDWTGSFGAASGISPAVTLAKGTHAVTLAVDDGEAAPDSDEVVVTVRDTTAPVISAVTVDPAVINSKNHKMVAVTVSGTATDLCDAHPTLRILSVTSNEAVNGLGDGDTDIDWEITGNLTLNLRAERSGNGTGRVYTITLVATDADGNSSTAAVTVTVP